MTVSIESSSTYEAVGSPTEQQLRAFNESVDRWDVPRVADLKGVDAVVHSLSGPSEHPLDAYGRPVDAETVAGAKQRARLENWIISDNAKDVQMASTIDDLDGVARRAFEEFVLARRYRGGKTPQSFIDFQANMRSRTELSAALIEMRDGLKRSEDQKPASTPTTPVKAAKRPATPRATDVAARPDMSKVNQIVRIKGGKVYRSNGTGNGGIAPMSDDEVRQLGLSRYELEQLEANQQLIREKSEEYAQLRADHTAERREERLNKIAEDKLKDRRKVAELVANVPGDVEGWLIARGVTPNSTNVKAYLDGKLFPETAQVTATVTEKQPGRIERLKARVASRLGRTARVGATSSSEQSADDLRREAEMAVPSGGELPPAGVYVSDEASHKSIEGAKDSPTDDASSHDADVGTSETGKDGLEESSTPWPGNGLLNDPSDDFFAGDNEPEKTGRLARIFTWAGQVSRSARERLRPTGKHRKARKLGSTALTGVRAEEPFAEVEGDQSATSDGVRLWSRPTPNDPKRELGKPPSETE